MKVCKKSEEILQILQKFVSIRFFIFLRMYRLWMISLTAFTPNNFGFQPFQGGSLLRLRFQSALRALSERFQSAFGSLPGRGTEMGADAESRATNGRPTIVRWLSDDRPTTVQFPGIPGVRGNY